MTIVKLFLVRNPPITDRILSVINYHFLDTLQVLIVDSKKAELEEFERKIVYC